MSPAQRKRYEETARREQAKSSPARKAVVGTLEGLFDLGKGLTVSDPNMPLEELRAASPWEKGGMLLATAPPGAPKNIKGLYSRVEQAVSKLPQMVHPNRAMSALKNAASGEEIKWRGLDKLLSPDRGRIPKSEIVEHLEQNPLDVKVTRRGEGPFPVNTTPARSIDEETVQNATAHQEVGTSSLQLVRQRSKMAL